MRTFHKNRIDPRIDAVYNLVFIMLSSLPVLPKTPKDRAEIYRLFNGMSVDGKEGIDEGRTRTPLVKSFLIEHVSDKHGGKPRNPAEIWSKLRAEPTLIDENFLSLQGEVKPKGKNPYTTTIGYLEQFDERFFAFYTVEGSQQAKQRVNRWIQRSAELDSTWFSAPLLQALWTHDISHRGDERFTKLNFSHDSVFELPEDSAAEENPADEDADGANGILEDEDDTVDHIEPERRRSRFMMGDRISRIRASLSTLQEGYDPLNALSAIRFPSLHRRGSHDLYQHGQVTNRSDSFEDHRNTIHYLYRIYRSVLNTTEERAWQDAEKSRGSLGDGISHKGVPLTIHFSEKLTKATFDCWIRRAFNKRNVFRLWGEPNWLGPTKVHVYGADRHLWQPLNLEITESQMVAILPQGTCGNTFHRLVTNLQRFVSPKISAWIGSQPFESMLEQIKTIDREVTKT